MYFISSATLGLVIAMLEAGSNVGIIGKWKTVEEINGFHLIMEFADNGLYSLTMRMEIEATYLVKGNLIHFSEMVLEIDELLVEGDAIYLKTPKGIQKLNRLSKPIHNVPSIVGKWGLSDSFEDGPKYSMELDLRKNGRCSSHVEFEPKVGSYKVNRDLLTTELEGESATNRFQIKKGLLIMEPEYEGGHKKKFRKMK